MPVSNPSPTHLAGGKPAESADFILVRRYRLAHDWAPPAGRVLLDFGSGTGAQTFLFSDDFEIGYGADVSESYLREFSRRAAELGIAHRYQALLYDGSRLSLSDASVDQAISFEVLEHVEDEAVALSELHRVLKPGGRLVMSVPNRWWIFETHGAKLPVLPWNRVPFFSWLPKSIHDRYARARIYRKREIVGKLEDAGFVVERSGYITAPMDVVRWETLRNVLRSTFFKADLTRIPFLGTAVLVSARKV